MHQLSRTIGVICSLFWILFSSNAAPQGGNVEHHFSPPAAFLKSVPRSRLDMAPNAAPFQMSPLKNPLYLQSLISSASNKLVQGMFSKRLDIPNYLTPPGGHLLPPGAQVGFRNYPGNPLAPQIAPPGPGYPFLPQQIPALPQAAPQVGSPPSGQHLTQKEFQQYLKAATASKGNTEEEYLTQGEFQKYLKLAADQGKKHKDQRHLSPEEFQDYVLQAQDARQQELLKSGKGKPGKIKTLTPEDFKKFFAKEKLPNGAPTGQKKHKRGHYSSSSGSFTSSGSQSFSEYPPQKYTPEHPPKYESEPAPEAYPDFYPAHQIETEDQATKRSVLDALWRAFQAITGGALTIGGHIAKGGGALLEAKGKLIASAGPVVSDFGRTVAAKAVASPNYSPSYHGTPYNYHDFPVESHGPQSSLLQTAYDVASSLKVAALGTTKAVADLISELSSASAKAYLLKE
ncbi:uncharacterized protein LOC132195452 [Neocloeon triangulifer]|uniref:uncharacterized protein LOC132195452 n=1 Tax=Neocloeon triangulifer TaxID=2078957 RepID=UPI00286F9CCF|nr:uncharacterized protein LOC132195452 [Neocloeon triangulifer]